MSPNNKSAVSAELTQTPTQISAALEFVIRYSNGGEQRVDTYPEAIALLKAEGCAEIGHDGDLESGGDHTTAWLTEADSVDDDGARSHASISGRYEPS